jgi:hypothetical protein
VISELPKYHRFEENGRQFIADEGGIWEIEPVGRRFLRSSEIPGRRILGLCREVEDARESAAAKVEAADREALGRLVREAWMHWARQHPNPKHSWLMPWEELAEDDREVDRQIGEQVAEFLARQIREDPA